MMRKVLFTILALLIVAATGAMAQTTYTVNVKGNTADAENWKSTPADAMTTTGVAATTQVTVSYTGTKIVKSVKANKKTLVPPTSGNTINLSTVTENVTALDGDILTGELSANVKILIKAGATVTLDGVTINGTNSDSYRWAGITCEGDATIILKDGTTNTVTGFHSSYPGIYVPGDKSNPENNKTLIIKGTGKLTVSCAGGGGGHACGIGGGSELPCGNIEIQGGDITATGGVSSAGIGGGNGSSCGNITISGGTVKATGGMYAAGIGSGSNGSSCGNITISGGTVTAEAGYTAAAIGSGGIGLDPNTVIDPSSCGNITIANTVTQVTAWRQSNNANTADNIGAGIGGSCGTVTIGGVKGAIRLISNGKTLDFANYFYYGKGDVTMTPTNNTNEWTLTMPASDVELTIAYFDATAPTATTGDIYADSGTPLVTAGTTIPTDTMMYKVTTTDTQPTSTEGFNKVVPTAKKLTTAGTYYVWYYIKNTNTNRSDSPILGPLPVTVIIDKSDLSNAIDDAEDYYNSIKDNYPNEAAALSEAIEDAKAVQANNGATVTDVATAMTTLYDAMGGVSNSKYTITLAENSVDTRWKSTPTEAMSTGVVVDTEVTLTYTGSRTVKSVNAKRLPTIVPVGETIDLSSVTKYVFAKDGDVLTGTLNANVKISIVPGATVTLDGVTINGTNNSGYPWAGINCQGDATIILKDGTENTVNGFYGDYPGIFVPSGKLLTIKGETAGTGKLTAISNGGGAGIGGGKGISCGNITISGGTVVAKTGTLFQGIFYNSSYGAGIGSGGVGSSCGNITISGGTVTATGGHQGAGIGSGGAESGSSDCSSCGNITISGGMVTATGGVWAAGIGSGWRGGCVNITINGGTVDATGGSLGAGIGSGYKGECGAIEITTGVTKVTAKKGGNTSVTPNGTQHNIGAGDSGSCGTVTIPNGTSTDSSYTYEGESTGPGSQSQEDENVTMTKTNTNEWTLTMPACNVELSMEYYPVAVATTDPAATNGCIYLQTDTLLITAGESSQGTFMYAVNQSNTNAPTDDFSATVPSAMDISTPGTYYVWYYILGNVGDEDHTYSNTEVCTTPIEATVTKGYLVKIAAGEYVTYYKEDKLKVENAENAALYTIDNVNGATATATGLTIAPANTPLLVKNKSENTMVIGLIATEEQADDVEAYEGFKGTLTGETVEAAEGYDKYAFNGKQFVKLKSLAISANKCWLEVPTSGNNARTLTLVFGEATGLSEERSVKSEESATATWYDLNGHKLNAVPKRKGIYILNGRKKIKDN